jgi:hypothetical protein
VSLSPKTCRGLPCLESQMQAPWWLFFRGGTLPISPSVCPQHSCAF